MPQRLGARKILARRNKVASSLLQSDWTISKWQYGRYVSKGHARWERWNESTVENEKWKEFEEFLEWKRSKQQMQNAREFQAAKHRKYYEKKYERFNQDPPPINKVALMARYIVNQADWTSVATISTRKDTKNFPTNNVISFSDGPLGNGSGIPYMYLTPLDFTAQDVSKDNRATLLMSLAEGDYCKQKDWDPMDPRCARVIMTGKIVPVNPTSPEIQIARDAVFERHPWLAHMPANHHFYFAKLRIMSIALLDTFGGPKFISTKDYLHPPTDNPSFAYFDLFQPQVKNV
ncbi:protein CREG1 [Prorops nasuta]|uniref:protein CREG1 n=1 Tax=Prorops nasuta TaxID=863751 RepID=UPI0034CF2AFF